MENIKWGELGFAYYKTAFNVRYHYANGEWSKMEVTDDEYIKMHMSAACLHYGLEIFEGLKAFRGVDGKVRLFRPDENAKRMINSANRLCLPAPTVEQFVEGCVECVRRNADFIPPYETGASLYLRPTLLGTKPCLGVRAVDEADLIIFCAPVGPYFKGGMTAIKALIMRDQDRAAPRGTGDVKVGGNYASSIWSLESAHQKGFSNVLYLDAATHTKVEEFGAANFFGIKDNKYVTPKSSSILPSITNKSLRQIAADLGLTVEERDIPVEELATFEEAGACGTAAVISPIGALYDLDNGVTYDYGMKVGETCKKMYDHLQGIQYGRVEDVHNWNVEVM